MFLACLLSQLNATAPARILVLIFHSITAELELEDDELDDEDEALPDEWADIEALPLEWEELELELELECEV